MNISALRVLLGAVLPGAISCNQVQLNYMAVEIEEREMDSSSRRRRSLNYLLPSNTL